MQVSDLKAGQGKVDIEVRVKSKAEPRTFNKYGKDLKVANAVVSDSSGEISMSLWNDDIDKVKEGDALRITNGYVSEFNGTKQLTAGKFGKMEIISTANSSADSSSSAPEKPADKPAKKAKKVSEPEDKEF